MRNREIGEKRTYGYTRVSSKGQHLDRGIKSIMTYAEAHNLKIADILSDTTTGKNYDRTDYSYLKKNLLRSGDTLIIPEYDRLGRAEETKIELEYFKDHNIRVIFLDIPTTQIDLSTLDNNMAKMILSCINDVLISVFDCIARTELEQKKKRQLEGIQAMKERGEWGRYGRPNVMDLQTFKGHYERVERGEIGSNALCRELNLSNSTFYRYVKKIKNEMRGTADE